MTKHVTELHYELQQSVLSGIIDRKRFSEYIFRVILMVH